MRHPLISIVAGTLCLLTFVSGVSYGADIPAIRDAKIQLNVLECRLSLTGHGKRTSLSGQGT